MRWASGATDDAEESRDALAEATDEDAARDVARLARAGRWTAGTRRASAAARAGATLGSEAAWLRESTDARAHPLFAGMERVALATGVQLRVLQRLPQTASFARRFASIGVDEDDSDEDGRQPRAAGIVLVGIVLGVAIGVHARGARVGVVSTQTRNRRDGTRRGRRDRVHGRHARGARRSRGGAKTRETRRYAARSVESESLVAEARASLLEGFAERVAVIAARRERAKWRRAEEVEGFDAKANAASRAAEDEANIRAELARELAAAEARATPKPTEKTDANATRTPSNATRTPSNARTPPFSRSLSPADVGSSPGRIFAPSASDRLDDVVRGRGGRVVSNRRRRARVAGPILGPVYALGGRDDAIRAEHARGRRGRARRRDASQGTRRVFRDDENARVSGPGRFHRVRLGRVRRGRGERLGRRRGSLLDDARGPAGDALPRDARRVRLARVLDRHRVVSRLVTAAVLDHLGAETHAAAVGKYILCGAGDFSSVLVEGVEAAARADAARGGWGATSHALRDALHAAVKESAASADPLAARVALRPRTEAVSRLAGDGRLATRPFVFQRTLRAHDGPRRRGIPRGVARESFISVVVEGASRRRQSRRRFEGNTRRPRFARRTRACTRLVARWRRDVRTELALRRRRVDFEDWRSCRLSFGTRAARAVEAHVGFRVHGAAAGPPPRGSATPRQGAPRPSDLYAGRDAMMEHARNAHEGCLLADRDSSRAPRWTTRYSWR